MDEKLRAAVPDFVVEQRLRAERGETRWGLWSWYLICLNLDGSGANYPTYFVCLLLAIMERGWRGFTHFFGPELTCTSAGKLLVPEHCTWGTWDMRQGNLSLHRWNDQDRASKVWRQAVKTLSWHSFPILLGGNTFFFLLFSAINMLLRRCMEQLVQTVDRLWRKTRVCCEAFTMFFLNLSGVIQTKIF